MKSVRRFSSVHREEIVFQSQECLWSEAGTPGLDYLIEQRKLSPEIIKQFKIGYVPLHARHQLSGRVVFPIYNSSNDLIVLTTRNVCGSDFLPTYWHEGYEKNFYLYGINIAKNHMRSMGYVIVVEGQFDVLQMHKHGFINTVGLCCTNLSNAQLALITRYCDKIVLLLDNDENKSGQKGASKILEEKGLLPFSPEDSLLKSAYGYHISPVNMGKPTDPDEYLIEYGRVSLSEKIERCVSEMKLRCLI